MQHQDAWNRTNVTSFAPPQPCQLAFGKLPRRRNRLCFRVLQAALPRQDIAIPADIRPRASTDVPHSSRIFRAARAPLPENPPPAWPEIAIRSCGEGQLDRAAQPRIRGRSRLRTPTIADSCKRVIGLTGHSIHFQRPLNALRIIDMDPRGRRGIDSPQFLVHRAPALRGSARASICARTPKSASGNCASPQVSA